MIHWGIMVILYKYEIGKKIAALAVRTRIKLLYELSECQFCINHHIALIMLGIWYLYDLYLMDYFGNEIIYLFYPIMSAALINLTVRK